MRANALKNTINSGAKVVESIAASKDVVSDALQEGKDTVSQFLEGYSPRSRRTSWTRPPTTSSAFQLGPSLWHSASVQCSAYNCPQRPTLNL